MVFLTHIEHFKWNGYFVGREQLNNGSFKYLVTSIFANKKWSSTKVSLRSHISNNCLFWQKEVFVIIFKFYWKILSWVWYSHVYLHWIFSLEYSNDSSSLMDVHIWTKWKGGSKLRNRWSKNFHFLERKRLFSLTRS